LTKTNLCRTTLISPVVFFTDDRKIALTDVGETGAKDNKREDDDGFREIKASVCLHPDISDNV